MPSVNSLASLAKCRDLEYLDLSQVGGSSIDFRRLKKAISNLSKLKILHLPIYIPITQTNKSDGEWPPNIHELKIGGTLHPEAMFFFDWPPKLMNLKLSKCKSLHSGMLNCILESPQLAEGLNRLTIEGDNVVETLVSLSPPSN